VNILNQVPGVVLQGEIPGQIMDRVIKVARSCERTYVDASNTTAQKATNWHAKKRQYMFWAWATVSKSSLKAFAGSRYYGYKSPYHEKYFQFYNEFFGTQRPKYVCCIRSFRQHLLSVQARWPRRSIAYIAMRYTMSLRQVWRMKQARPADVICFFLDDYIARGAEYLIEELFMPLELDEFDGALKKAAQGPANSSSQLGVSRKDALTPAQEFFLRVYPAPLTSFERLRIECGCWRSAESDR
jgi:hypothetical protein